MDNISTPTQMNAEIEILWRMMNEHYTYARHHESQRSNLTNYVLLLQGALLVYGKDKMSDGSLVPITLILSGLLGVVLVYKFYERARSHMDAAKIHRDALDKKLGMTPSLSDLRRRSKKLHEPSQSSRLIGKVNLYKLWIGFQLLIVCIGALLLLKLI